MPNPALVQSIRQRLENLARKSDQDIQRTLVRYALERLLHRLSLSSHREQFILKGAMLFSVWEHAPYRATGDLDLLGYGDNSESAMVAIFKDICSIDPEPADGLVFNADEITATSLRRATDYNGVALRFDATLGRARLRLQVDIGFGDAVTPNPKEIEYPTLLDMPAPRLRAYPPETVIAEKLEAIVSIGVATTRIKDFFDIWAIAQAFDFDRALLSKAIRATFERRGTPTPIGPPAALSAAYAEDTEKQRLWRAFVQDRIDADAAPSDLASLTAAILVFVAPLFTSVANGTSPGHWVRNEQTWR